MSDAVYRIQNIYIILIIFINMHESNLKDFFEIRKLSLLKELQGRVAFYRIYSYLVCIPMNLHSYCNRKSSFCLLLR